jgi:predicted enzyme related to lactoylglutathione lyase
MELRQVLTILAVDDLAHCVAFYRRVFAWEQTVDVASYAEFSLPWGQRFGLYQREGFGANTGQRPVRIAPGELAPTELYFHTDDLPAAIGALRDAGARELSALAPRPWGDEAAYFADPAGNVLVVARPLVASS